MNGILAFLLFVSPAFSQQPGATSIPAPQEGTVEFPKFDCGLITSISGHRIGDGCLQVADNVLYDKDASIYRRPGYSKFNAVALSTPAAIRRLYRFDDSNGNNYLVAVSSDKIWSAVVGGTFTVIPGFTGLSSTENTDCVQGLGRLWCVNQQDGLKFWNGTSTGTAASGPLGSLIDMFRNRVLISNVAGSRSSLFGSGDINGEDWTTANQSTSPFIIRINGVNDGEAVTCLMGTYNDTYIIGTENRLYGLYGFDNDDFVLRELSREVGCLDDTSVQEMDGSLHWLSKRGIERMRGTSIDWRISDPIINVIEEIVVSAGDSRRQTDTTQADFEAGNLTASGEKSPMSSTISPGSVVPTTWTRVDDSTTNILAGTYINISTTDVPGYITISSRTLRDNFGDGDLTVGQATWTITAGAFPIVTIGSKKYIGPNSQPNTINTTLLPISSGSWSWIHNSQSVTCSTSKCFSMRFMKNASNDFYAIEHDLGSGTDLILSLVKNVSSVRTVLASSTTSRAEYQTSLDHQFEVQRSTDGRMYAYIDGIFLGSTTDTSVSNPIRFELAATNDSNATYFTNFYFYQYYSKGQIISTNFDTGLSTPTWGTFFATHSVSDSGDMSVSFFTQVSADNVTYDSAVGATTTIKIGSAQKRYIRYETNLITSISTKTPTYSAASLTAATTGHFISQCFNPGSSISSWGLFQCNKIDNGGDFTFYVSTGSSCSSVTRTTSSWVSQANNAPISLPISSHVGYRVLFDLDIASETPTLQDCTINWNVGTARPEVASGVFDHRYHLFYTTATTGDPVNSNALVLDQYDRWSLWNNIPARSATLYNRKLYIGDGAATGFVRQLYSGDDDDGTSFTSRIRTKDFDLGMFRQKKTYGNLWLEFSPESDAADNVSMSISAYLDLTNKYTLNTVNLDEDTGLVTASVPWPDQTQQSGRYFSLDVINSGTKPWVLYRGSLDYKPLREE